MMASRRTPVMKVVHVVTRVAVRSVSSLCRSSRCTLCARQTLAR